jgi:predicted nucleotidyltransferase
MKHTNILIGLVGSHAYNLEDKESDRDYRGIFIPDIDYYFGNKKIEQITYSGISNSELEIYKEKEDLVLYEFKKVINLLTNNNPNILELLWLDSYIELTPLGKRLIDNRDIFLSKKVKSTYIGYAHSEINKVETRRDYILNPPLRAPTLSEYNLESLDIDFTNKDKLNSFLEFIWFLIRERVEYLDTTEEFSRLKDLILEKIDSKRLIKEEELSSESIDYINKCINASGTMELIQRCKQYQKAKNRWNKYQYWLNNRNIKRANLELKAGYDTKHISQCVRLLYQSIELLTNKTLVVGLKNKPYYTFIKDIKVGLVPYKEVKDHIEELFKEVDKAYSSTLLPNNPPLELINTLSIDILSEHFKGIIE